MGKANPVRARGNGPPFRQPGLVASSRRRMRMRVCSAAARLQIRAWAVLLQEKQRKRRHQVFAHQLRLAALHNVVTMRAQEDDLLQEGSGIGTEVSKHGFDR